MKHYLKITLIYPNGAERKIETPPGAKYECAAAMDYIRQVAADVWKDGANGHGTVKLEGQSTEIFNLNQLAGIRIELCEVQGEG